MVRHASDKTAALLPNVSPAGEARRWSKMSEPGFPFSPTTRPELCSLVRRCGSDSKSGVSFLFFYPFPRALVEFFCESDSFLFTIQFFVNVGFALRPTSLFDFLHEMDRRQPSSSVQLFLRTARPFCSLGPKITVVMHLKRLAVFRRSFFF